MAEMALPRIMPMIGTTCQLCTNEMLTELIRLPERPLGHGEADTKNGDRDRGAEQRNEDEGELHGLGGHCYKARTMFTKRPFALL